MPGDMQLFREILMEAYKGPFRLPADADRFGDHDPAEVMRHAEWLEEGGLLQAAFLGSHDASVEAIVQRVTWNGLEFLNSAQNETVWQRAFNVVRAQGGAVSLSVMKALLEQKTKEMFGIGGP